MAKKTKPKSAWNKGKIVGPKPALTARQVMTIRGVLAERAPLRDQVLFSLAIDSCLRGSDLVRLKVSDVMLSGELINLAQAVFHCSQPVRIHLYGFSAMTQVRLDFIYSNLRLFV
jgi:hypothetical protein